jgi:DNA-binding NtrC family response regulator
MTYRHIKGATVLVAEDNMLVALNIALALEDREAHVLGPCARVSEALRVLDGADIVGAILDVDLIDGPVTPLAQALIAKDMPIVFCTGVGLPEELKALIPDATVFLKPTEPERLIDKLNQMISAGVQASS